MPKKRAVISGISDYLPPSKKLTGTVPAAEAWEALLKDKYGFTDAEIRLRRNEQATVDVITDDLKWLLKGAGDDDQLVFIHCGHGTEVLLRPNRAEEALLMYHAEDQADSAVITDSALSLLVKGANPPKKADITVVLECCFAGGLDIWPVPPQSFSSRKVIWPLPVIASERLYDIDPDIPVNLFGAMTEFPEFTGARPIVIAACEEGKTAAQLASGKDMVFSSIAVPILGKTAATTHRTLVQAVEKHPTARAFEQIPILNGDTLRESNSFLF